MCIFLLHFFFLSVHFSPRLPGRVGGKRFYVSLCSNFVLFVVCDVCLLVTGVPYVYFVAFALAVRQGIRVCPIFSYHFYNDHKLFFYLYK